MEGKHQARILLVDDEAAIVKLMQTYLSRMGYSVETSLDADDAFAAVERSTSPYDLVVADLTLPGMSGQDMALAMVRDNPSLKVLLCSGYPLTVESLPENVQDRFACLQKPFAPTMLADAIEELLQRRVS